jgi:hypothetical protein
LPGTSWRCQERLEIGDDSLREAVFQHQRIEGSALLQLEPLPAVTSVEAVDGNAALPPLLVDACGVANGVLQNGDIGAGRPQHVVFAGLPERAGDVALHSALEPEPAAAVAEDVQPASGREVQRKAVGAAPLDRDVEQLDAETPAAAAVLLPPEPVADPAENVRVADFQAHGEAADQ